MIRLIYELQFLVGLSTKAYLLQPTKNNIASFYEIRKLTAFQFILQPSDGSTLNKKRPQRGSHFSLPLEGLWSGSEVGLEPRFGSPKSHDFTSCLTHRTRLWPLTRHSNRNARSDVTGTQSAQLNDNMFWLGQHVILAQRRLPINHVLLWTPLKLYHHS